MDGFGYAQGKYTASTGEAQTRSLLWGCVLHPSSAPVSFLMTSRWMTNPSPKPLWHGLTFPQKLAFTDQEVTLTADVTDHIHPVAGDMLIFWVGEEQTKTVPRRCHLHKAFIVTQNTNPSPRGRT